MNGLSPAQPRSPPVYVTCGLKSNAALIQPIESFTSQVESTPRLNRLTRAVARDMASRTASRQSCTYRYDLRCLPFPSTVSVVGWLLSCLKKYNTGRGEKEQPG